MKPYAEPSKKIQVQSRGYWCPIETVSFEGWLLWLQVEMLKHIDTELRDMIVNLNRRGFITHLSCAGHDGYYGEVVFYGIYPEAEIIELLKPYYLKITDVKHLDSEHWHSEFYEEHWKMREDFMRDEFPDYVCLERSMENLTFTKVSFEGIGQSKRRKRPKGKQLALIGI